MKNKMRLMYRTIVDLMVRNVPGPIGSKIRYFVWRSRFLSIGSSVRFGVNVNVHGFDSIRIGDNCWIDDNVTLIAGPPREREFYKSEASDLISVGEISIGENVHIAIGVIIQGHGGVFIGSDSGIASGSRIYSMSHHYKGKGDMLYKFTPMVELDLQSIILSPVIIGDSAAVGLNSVLLPGATLGERSWLASASVLMSKIPPDRIAAGNPASAIKTIRE